ncbi:MAG: hypothetical protein M1383_00360 [Patescibacteria group bacterium]|nr:hypothetical protein [Patescibacteria group bacterium]
MITQDDIKLIIEAEKEVFPTREDFSDLRKDFHDLQTSVDKYAKKADTYYQEMAVMRHRLERLEEWVKEAAGKIGLEFKV